MATAKTLKGFSLTCPWCGRGEDDGTITLDVNDLKACRCTSCDEEFSPREGLAKAAELVTRWQGFVRWIESAAEVLAAPQTDVTE
jgi:hypothetical protein